MNFQWQSIMIAGRGAKIIFFYIGDHRYQLVVHFHKPVFFAYSMDLHRNFQPLAFGQTLLYRIFLVGHWQGPSETLQDPDDFERLIKKCPLDVQQNKEI